jgi:hypothetical protein
MKQPNEQKLQQHLRAKARLMEQVQARVIDATHLRFNRHAHCLTFEEIVATNVRPMETSNRQREDNERLGLNATTNTRSPAGFNRVSRGDQPLDRTANVFKSSNQSSSNCSVFLKRESHWRYLKPNNSKGITVEFIAESCCVYAVCKRRR